MFVPANSSHSSFDPEKVVISDQSLRQLLSTVSCSTPKYEIVNLKSTIVPLSLGSSVNSVPSTERAILFSNEVGTGEYEATYIVPFKELDDGTLVNSFAYAELFPLMTILQEFMMRVITVI